MHREIPTSANAVSTAAFFWDSVCDILDDSLQTNAVNLSQQAHKSSHGMPDRVSSQLSEVMDAVSMAAVELGLQVGRDPDEYWNYLQKKGAWLAQQSSSIMSRMDEFGPSSSESDALNDRYAEISRELRILSDVLANMEERFETTGHSNSLAVKVAICESDPQVTSITLRRGLAADSKSRCTASTMSDCEREANVASCKAFVKDLIVPYGICPYTTSPDLAATGKALSRQGIRPGPILYPVSDAATAEQLFRDFFKCAENLLSTPESEASTVLLLAPKFAASDFAEYALFTVGLENMLINSGAKNDIGFVAFHPQYDRNLVHPRNGLTSGHLPPAAFLQSYLRKYFGSLDGNSINLDCANYARRCPQPMINILRASHLAAINKGNLLPQQRIYAANAKRLSDAGIERLDSLGQNMRRILLSQPYFR